MLSPSFMGSGTFGGLTVRYWSSCKRSASGGRSNDEEDLMQLDSPSALVVVGVLVLLVLLAIVVVILLVRTEEATVEYVVSLAVMSMFLSASASKGESSTISSLKVEV
jgi:hypothetical protein